MSGGRFRSFFRHRGAAAGLLALLLVVALAALAPWLAPHDPFEQPDIAALKLQSPSARFLLGSDQLSRDVLSRILYGLRVPLAVGFLAMAVSVSLGTALGALAAYRAGWMDSLLMRTADLLLSFPRLVLLLLVVGLLPQERSLLAIVLVLGLTGWMSTGRLVRAEVLSLREREFVLGAKALGLSGFRVFWSHILPNCTGVIVVSATLGLAGAVLWEVYLSFLGVGLPPPHPSLGSMVAEGVTFLQTAPWVAIFPALAIVGIVLSAHLVGEGLRDAFDPKQRGAFVGG